jgi:hypothetical protein
MNCSFRPNRLLPFSIFRWRSFLLVVALLASPDGRPFALLGPFESWQVGYIGYNVHGTDVGAPKNLGEEFRWNIPVVTYGFDRNFIDFFGDEGIHAVNAAFDILNQLPPASRLDLNNYSFDTRRVNLHAQTNNLIDLKSTVLSLVLEQIGLAASERYVWTLRDKKIVNLPNGQYQTNYLVLNRNFDPLSWDFSAVVNGTRLTYDILEFQPPFFFGDAVERVTPPNVSVFTVVGFATGPAQPAPGIFLTNLTRDDVGGIRYLLHPSNQNFEPVVSGPLDSTDPFTSPVQNALRPGVDKIQFQPITDSWQTDPGWRRTNSWTDSFYVNGALQRQSLARAISSPDIIFSAADTGVLVDSTSPALFTRSNPNWSSVSQFPFLSGPGIINPGALITLNKLGGSRFNTFPGFTDEASSTVLSQPPRWASFDSGLNVVVFPRSSSPSAPVLSVLSAGLLSGSILGLSGAATSRFEVQISTNLQNWFATGSILSATNSFTAPVPLSEKAAFFRAIAIGP